MEKFKADFTGSDVRNSVARDLQLAQKIGASSTPTFALNGIIIRPRNFDELSTLIREGISATAKIETTE